MIGAVAAFGLLLAGLLLLTPKRGPWASATGKAGVRGLVRRLLYHRSPGVPAAAASLHDAALMVAQLAALLRAGRSPEQLWSQAGSSSSPAFAGVLGAAARAAALGAPVAGSIRKAAASGHARRRQSVGNGTADQTVLWHEVAACIEAAEDSGCPLAGVFDRLSAQLEADADAAAARGTALAGPKATTQILTALPVVGLGLGALIGADPFNVLLGTPLGLVCLGVGGALTVLGRSWSSRLVAAAAVLR